METTKTTKTTKGKSGCDDVQHVHAIITGYLFSDEALDALIDMTFRLVERLMLDPRVMSLVKLGMALQR